MTGRKSKSVSRGMRLALAGLAVAGAAALLPGAAGAVSPAVRKACANDYFAHCSMHAPDTPGVRKCMRAVGPRLSKTCIGALAAAGEITAADRRRHKQASATR